MINRYREHVIAIIINRFREEVTERGEYFKQVITICQENIAAVTLNHHRDEIIAVLSKTHKTKVRRRTVMHEILNNSQTISKNILTN